MLKVEGHNFLVKDPVTKAVLNNDDAAYEAARKWKMNQAKTNNLQIEVSELKSELSELKQLLSQIVNSNANTNS